MQYGTLCPEGLCMKIMKKLQIVETHMIVYGATRFYSSGFFHESVSPKPLSILLRPFRFFFQKFADLFAAEGAPVANQKIIFFFF
jgi:hypothetical protein